MSVRDLLIDEEHPLRSPLLGILVSRTVCALGHDVVVMDLETWEEEWLACQVCGARFVPASVIGEDTDVVEI